MSRSTKWLLGIGALVLLWLALRKKSSTASQTAGETDRPHIDSINTQGGKLPSWMDSADDARQKLVAINQLAQDTWGTAPPATSLFSAGPDYPGFFRTPDGGWVNPDTGEAYSPGSSPPKYFNPYDQPPKVVVDLNTPPIVGAQPLPPGDIIL
jgi:hypothetical protein